MTPIEQAAAKLGAVPADFGLWQAPGYPELTRWQLLDAASRHDGTVGMIQAIVGRVFR